MSAHFDIAGVAIQVSRGIVIASIQVDLDDDVVARFRDDLLQRIHETGSRAVIMDVSALETIDSEEFAALRTIIRMAKIMGAESVLSGLRPGIISALMEVDVDVEGMRAAINLDAAFELIQAELALPTEQQSVTDVELESIDEDPMAATGEFTSGVQDSNGQ